jgi:hypothetical protein
VHLQRLKTFQKWDHLVQNQAHPGSRLHSRGAACRFGLEEAERAPQHGEGEAEESPALAQVARLPVWVRLSCQVLRREACQVGPDLGEELAS